jgi:hypothetical protein
MDMAMFIYPMDTVDIMKKLRNKVGQLESSMSMNAEKGNVRDPMLETAYQDVEGLRDRLQQGTERYFRFSLYFTSMRETLKDLDQLLRLWNHCWVRNYHRQTRGAADGAGI